MIARRPASADDVAVWARDAHGEEETSTYPEIAANGALALLVVGCSLLDRQISALEKSFVAEGGFTERLYRVRSDRRKA